MQKARAELQCTLANLQCVDLKEEQLNWLAAVLARIYPTHYSLASTPLTTRSHLPH
jgi:hypothetical protein